MLSNDNLLNAQNAYITQLQKENDDLKAKLRKAADDVLTADALRIEKSNALDRMKRELAEERKLVEEMRSAAAQHSRDGETISQFRRHNMELRAELERFRKSTGYTGVPMNVELDGQTFQNNKDGLKNFAQAIRDAERKEFKDAIDRYYKQFITLSNENHRLEQHLRSAENALEEKDAELEAIRAHCGERSERNADQKPAFTPPPTKKVVLTSCTLEEREEALKCLRFMEDHITGFLDRMMKR